MPSFSNVSSKTSPSSYSKISFSCSRPQSFRRRSLYVDHFMSTDCHFFLQVGRNSTPVKSKRSKDQDKSPTKSQKISITCSPTKETTKHATHVIHPWTVPRKLQSMQIIAIRTRRTPLQSSSQVLKVLLIQVFCRNCI